MPRPPASKKHAPLASLLARLQAAGLDASLDTLADLLWLATRLPAPATPPPRARPEAVDDHKADDARADDGQPTAADEGERAAELDAGTSAATEGAASTPLYAATLEGGLQASTLRVPGVASDDAPESLRRALQPFARRLPSPWRDEIDEEATAAQAVQTRVWQPVTRPQRERWFDLGLVVEASASMDLWSGTMASLARTLRGQGGFRSVTRYRLDDDPQCPLSSPDGRRRWPASRLRGRGGRSLVLLATDTASARWRQGTVPALLHGWGGSAQVTLLVPLARPAWRHTWLGEPAVHVWGRQPGAPNTALQVLRPWWMDGRAGAVTLPVPVVGLDAASLAEWARMAGARGGAETAGVLMAAGTPDALAAAAVRDDSAAARVAGYRGRVSGPAYELAVFLSVVDPLTVPVMRLVQRTMLPDTDTSVLAEFFLGGLLQRLPAAEGAEPLFRMPSEVRELLVAGLRYSQEDAINTQLRTVGRWLQAQYRGDAAAGRIEALFPAPGGAQRLSDWALPFASVSRELLRQRVSGGVVEPAPVAAETVQPTEAANLAPLLLLVQVEGETLRFNSFEPGRAEAWSGQVDQPLGELQRRAQEGSLSDEDAPPVPASWSALMRRRRGAVMLSLRGPASELPWEAWLPTDLEENRNTPLALNRAVLRVRVPDPSRAPTMDWLKLPRTEDWVIGDPTGSMPDLPGAQAEAAEVAAVLRRRAPRDAVREAIEAKPRDIEAMLASRGCRVLFIGGHGLRDVRDGRMTTRVPYGTGGWLEVQAVAAMKPPPQLVFLGIHYGADWAEELLRAGVQAVVAGFDVVDDHSPFVGPFFEALGAGRTLGKALLVARQAAAGRGGTSAWAQYACWGGADWRLPQLADAEGERNAAEPYARSAAPPTRNLVYLSCTNEDLRVAKELRDRLSQELSGQPQLRAMVQDFYHPSWDTATFAQWTGNVERALGQSLALIFVVSARSIVSRSCLEEEVGPAVVRGLPVVPLVIEHCDWISVPVPGDPKRRTLGQLQGVSLLAEDRERGWTQAIDALMRAMPHWLPDKPSPAGSRDRQIQALFAACMPVQHARRPGGTRTVTWFGSDLALTCGADPEGFPSAKLQVVDPWQGYRRLTAEKGVLFIGDPVGPLAGRDSAQAAPLQSLQDIPAARRRGSRRFMALAREDVAEGAGVQARVLYFQGQQQRVTQVWVRPGPEREHLWLDATSEDLWPLPPEALGAPVVMENECIGLVEDCGTASRSGSAKTARTLRVALRAVWLVRLHAGLPLHRQWLDDPATGTRLSLPGADLAGMMMRGFTLAGADLAGARLDRADLAMARLDRANLKGASLRDANLREASLVEADLQHAHFENADLASAVLRGADLRRAYFRRAKLAGTTFEGSRRQGATFDPEQVSQVDQRMPLVLIDAEDVLGGKFSEQALPGHRLLVLGDSWLIGHDSTPNLLDAITLARTASAVVSASRGQRLPDHLASAEVQQLLGRKNAWRWQALLLAVGGDDLIQALAVPLVDARGRPAPPMQRLLLSPPEWAAEVRGASRWFSLEGLQAFEAYLRANLAELVLRRDRSSSKGCPIILLGHPVPLPRPASMEPGRGPWLLPAFERAGIPASQHADAAAALFDELRTMFLQIAGDGRRFPQVYYVDSRSVRLQSPESGSTGSSGDWADEIHLNASGVAKLAGAWGPWIDRLLDQSASA